MPPRPRRAPIAQSLTADDLTALQSALTEGRRATVYLRGDTPSLGLVAGTSARVVSISGSTVVIKPTGVNDELPYDAEELRRTKKAPPAPPARTTPPRKRATTPKTPPAAPAKTTAASTPTAPVPTPKAAKAVAAPTTESDPLRAVTVTLYGSVANEWSVSVSTGGRKPNGARAITAEAIEGALASLGDKQALEAASPILSAARDEAKRRVDELTRELAAARDQLAALERSSRSARLRG